jgi:nucleotide-binding universal stress UspA family protein
MHPIRIILFPTDFSEYSLTAFHFACSLAGHYAAKLVIVHVKEPPVVVGELVAPVMPETETDRKALQEQLAKVQPSNPNFAVEHHLLDGRPANEILKAAQSLGADVIVIGTHGRGILGRVLMGSVATEVVRKAPCAVLTVKLPKGSYELAQGHRGA